MKLSVISPTLNEAENVPRLVEELGLALRDVDYEILIVDDNSPDRTWSVAHEIAAANPRVRTLRRMQNPGLGLAVMDGFAAAEGDVVACIDADLQHDPAILSKMLQEFDKGADVVVGSRHVQGGSTGDWDRLRRLQSWLATRTAQFFLGIRLKDPMSGYFLFSRKDFDGVKEDLNGSGFKILLEILANLRPEQVTEVPYTFRSRTRGESKLSNKVILQYLQQVWRLCGSSRHFSIRLLKSAAGGAVETLLNLALMALLLVLTNVHNWRASALACLGAMGLNYFLHQARACAAGAGKDFRNQNSYFSYLLMSAAGLLMTTISYAGLCRSLLHAPLVHFGSGAPLFFARMSCQFVAVLLGMGFNYALNRMFDWPAPVRLNWEAPAKAPILR
ncbi:MAG: glycosyltransferase family 2 protein [Acidobacteriia bacterium]|nr:glycosyltransferase family 2 protein [Terriglobia bacterium]